MVCPRCGRDNPDENEFCGRCGTKLRAAQAAREVAPVDEEMVCYRHKREKTTLRCGRCERPICHRCVVIGPAGSRCPDCARQNVAVRPGAIAHEAKVGLRRIFQLGPWSIYIWIVLFGMVFGSVRGCMAMRQSPPPRSAPIDRDVETPLDATPANPGS